MILRWVGVFIIYCLVALLCGLLTFGLSIPLMKVLTLTHGPALLLPYVLMVAVGVLGGNNTDLVSQTWLVLPVIPRRQIWLSPVNLALWALYALVLPSALAWGFFYFGNVTVEQAIVVFIACATAVLLGINHQVNPAPWDAPLFALRAMGHAWLWIVKRTGCLGLFLIGVALVMLFYPGAWLKTFIERPLGSNPLAEVAYFFISPIGSIWRLQLGDAPPWMPLALQGVLVAGAVAAAVSVWRTLRAPIRELETAEFDAFQADRPSSTYLGRIGAVDQARRDDVEGADDGKENDEAPTFEQLKQGDESYMEGATPEAVLENDSPVVAKHWLTVMLVVFCGVLIGMYFEGYLTWDRFLILVRSFGLLWIFIPVGLVQAPGFEAHCLPGRWPVLVRQQFRKSGRQLVGVNVAVALATTAAGAGPWWLFFVMVALYAETYFIYNGIQWLSLHEKDLRRVAGLTALMTVLVLAMLGGVAVLVAVDDPAKFAKQAGYLAAMLAVYMGVVLLPLVMWHAHRTGWQINSPAPPRGAVENLLSVEVDEDA
ncbi:hypothetical protein CVU37_09775 [candidate division BRC1 bacterium HGW-BRC1-1]|jgi:hypothetical protein|nr:MAG: hypothetical protein CVU37_09775 [candidate division BRC1 bacterium HGW-BRC1-1]